MFIMKVVTYAQISSAGVQSSRQKTKTGGNFDCHSMRSVRGDGVWTMKILLVKKSSGGCLNDGVKSKRAQALSSSSKQEYSSKELGTNTTGPCLEKKIVEEAVTW